MGGYVHNLLYASFGLFAYGIDPMAAVLAAGFVLLVAAAQFSLLFRKKRGAWIPALCGLAALLPSMLLYWALSSGVSVWFLDGYTSNLIVYAAVAAVYCLPGILTGWLAYAVYLTWTKFQSRMNP